MEYTSIFFSFIFGTVVGSFLNVVSLRFNTGKGIGGRSGCMTCGKTLSWFELIPILSFLIQKGSCRKCKGSISYQYPLVEFLAGAIFVLIFIAFPPTTLSYALKTILYILITCVLLVISIYDMKHKIIPDQFSLAFSILAIISLFVGGESLFHIPSLISLLAGPILALPFALLWLVSRGKWMGLGDAKLMLGIGWLLGINAGLNAVILAFWIAAAAGLTWMYIVYRSYKAKAEIPFGPYLILGMYIVLLFDIKVLDLDLIRNLLIS